MIHDGDKCVRMCYCRHVNRSTNESNILSQATNNVTVDVFTAVVLCDVCMVII